ncbi:UBC-like protein [Tricholoma matsutake]|nr:UBC-like protein [Tricholoma matsutake 945]
MAATSLNKNNSAVKRIMQEAKELANDPCTDYTAAPLEDDIFEWHCTLRGPAGTDFEGGLYHFRILLPAEYPFRPPSIMMITPNGRFELNTKICISFTSYHEELWQPAWGVRTGKLFASILGLQGFFPLKGQAAVGVGSIETSSAERKRLAALSREWVCPHCQQPNSQLLPDPADIAPETRHENLTSESTDVPQPSSLPSDSELSSEKTVTQDVSLSTESLPPPLRAAANDLAESQPATRSIDSIIPSAAITHSERVASGMIRSTRKPPLVLDTIICVLLAMVVAMIWRRII